MSSAIELTDVSKTIKGNVVLQGVSLQVPYGRVVGLQGINGSGKTMLMRTICGLVKPGEGVVSINGKLLGKEIDFPPSIGVLLEGPAFLDHLTGLKNLELLAQIKGSAGLDDCREAMRRVGLEM